MNIGAVHPFQLEFKKKLFKNGRDISHNNFANTGATTKTKPLLDRSFNWLSNGLT